MTLLVRHCQENLAASGCRCWPFIERCRLTDGAGLDAALLHLDEQHERAMLLRQHLKQLHDVLIEGHRDMAAFMNSPAGEAFVHSTRLQGSKIVTLLAQATQTLARADGWTILSSAGHYITAQDPEQLPSINLRFGHRGLQSLVVASELSEVRQERIGNGVTRTVYRIRPGEIEFV